MRPPLITAFLVAAVACGDSPGGGPAVDAGDSDADGGELTSGLRIEFEPAPEIPGGWDNGLAPMITAAELVLEDFRVAGDADPDRTMVEELILVWPSESTLAVEFADAPIGRYSRIRASIDSLDVEGTLELDSETEDWEIDDRPPGGIDIDLEIAVDLEPGEIETIRLQIDLQPLFEAVDWTQADTDDGVLTVDEDSDMIDAVRDRLDEAVTVVPPGD